MQQVGYGETLMIYFVLHMHTTAIVRYNFLLSFQYSRIQSTYLFNILSNLYHSVKKYQNLYSSNTNQDADR